MIKGGIGGANTQTGLHFEGRSDLLGALLKLPGYTTDGNNIIYFHNIAVAQKLQKNLLYAFLNSKGVNYKNILSKKLLPDEALYVYGTKTLYVVEMKFQQVAGSVDEKLQTCDFKKKQYTKLMNPLGINVEYIYLLSDWFSAPAYKDVLNYVKEVGCDYSFNGIELSRLGLPN
jgi:hypothetical protein